MLPLLLCNNATIKGFVEYMHLIQCVGSHISLVAICFQAICRSKTSETNPRALNKTHPTICKEVTIYICLDM